MDAIIVFVEQRDNHNNLLVLFTKHRQLAHQAGDSHAFSIIKKEAMAPCTHIGLALSMALGGRIRFGSLEFADIDGPAPVNGLIPRQALRFGDLDFVTNCLGQLRLSERECGSTAHLDALSWASAN